MSLICYLTKMMLGWICYQTFMRLPAKILHKRRLLHDFLLSWAGFYAYDTGFDDYCYCQHDTE